MSNLSQSLFPAFNGENYDSWSVKMRLYLILQGLWDLVENGYDNGDNSKAESSKDVEAKEMYLKDKEALLMILQAIPESMVPSFANVKTSKEAWTILNQKYHPDKKENFSANQNVPKRQHKESGGDTRDNIDVVEEESSGKAEKQRRISNPEDFSNVSESTENVIGTLLHQSCSNPNVNGDITNNTSSREEVEASTPSQSSPITTTGSEFEVFLSFRGKDTRKGFTGHLYDGLQLRGISTFKDDVNLDKGKDIDRLLEYIEKSKIFVPIFSQNYADSKWCLKEVTKSVECGKEIVPVFFRVEPSDVQNQRGSFEAVFKKHESNEAQNQDEVKKWREALKIVGNKSGFTLKEKNEDELELKRAIIERVLNIVNKKPLQVAKHPIGIKSRVEDVKRMLKNIGGEGVRVIGIYGMGGLGKTTIAMAVYNELAERFSGATCFLSDVRENARPPNGLVTLQKKVFHEIFKDENIYLSNVAHGKSLIQARAHEKRVLLILDDVDSKTQIEALAGERDWFGSGSVIIITTRDENVLLAHNVDKHEIYEPAVLDTHQSRDLFLQYAFNGKKPEGDYLQLSNEVIVAAAGLPLTLEVLGSLFTCHMNVNEWKYMLERLKKIPPQEVLQRLKLSYDKLQYIHEQKIFLDISCFFIGWGRQYATYMWEDCGWFPKHAIEVLEQRSLIKIDDKSKEFRMHDQIRDMGRAIVEEESFGKVEKKSRVWNSKDSSNFLQRKVPKTIAAEGIRIIPEGDNIISAECFQNMADLRYFDARHLNFQGTLDCFPRDLKWLELWKCKFDSPPFDHLNLQQLVILQLHETKYLAQILVQQLPLKAYEKLKVLKIDDPTIKISADFTNISCLVELSLSRLALTTIDESIGKLKKLTYLEISRCSNLKNLPDSLGSMGSLQVLSMTYCHKIMFLPEQLGDIRSLKKLDLNSNSGIVNLPDSIWKLSLLEFLDLSGCTNFCSLPKKLGGMENLKELFLDHTKIKVIPDLVGQLKNLEGLFLRMCNHLCSLPERLGDMENLKKLIVIDTNIEVLPDSIGQLKNLERLSIRECYRSRAKDLLRNHFCSLPERLGDMENLRELILHGIEIEVIPDSVEQLKNLEQLSLKDCNCLSSLPERLGNMENLRELILDGTKIEVIPHSVGQLKNLKQVFVKGCTLKKFPSSITHLLFNFNVIINKFTGSSFELIELSNHWYKSLEDIELIDDGIKELPDCIKEMENLKKLTLSCEMLTTLPNWIQRLSERLTELSINSKHLAALPNCVGKFYRLEKLSLDCENLKALPDSMGTLQNLTHLSVNSKHLTALPDGVGKFYLLQNLSLDDCKSLEYLPQLPSSLSRLSTSACTSLQKISDVSNLKMLKYLNLRGCKLLEDVPGLQNISNNLRGLQLPGPCDLRECCSFSHDFKNKVFKEMAFAGLDSFGMSGSMETGSLTGQQQLHFMIPSLPFDWLECNVLELKLEKVDSPVHVEIMADNVLIFEKSLELSNDDFSGKISWTKWDLENIKKIYNQEISWTMWLGHLINIGKIDEHCYTIQVTTAEASQLQRVHLLLTGNMITRPLIRRRNPMFS